MGLFLGLHGATDGICGTFLSKPIEALWGFRALEARIKACWWSHRGIYTAFLSKPIEALYMVLEFWKPADVGTVPMAYRRGAYNVKPKAHASTFELLEMTHEPHAPI